MPRKIHVTSYRRSDGVRVTSHNREVITSSDQGRTGQKFRKLENTVARQNVGKSIPFKYRSEYHGHKRYTNEDAHLYGQKVAGKVFYAQYGKRKAKIILRREHLNEFN